MVLEAIMICADNSEPMRNGDYSPTRLEAQAETINYIASNKIGGNQETQVGIMSMAGRRLEVHLSPSRAIGTITQILNKEIKVSGESNFSGALKTAQLVLKNRQNKNQRQRIIMFVGSPVKDETKDLVKLGKLLKKNNVAVDIINFGLENGPLQRTKLEEFINAVNSSDNSHLVHVPPGPHQLSDMVMTSPILVDAAAARTGPAAAAGGSAATGGAAAARPAAGGANQDEEDIIEMTLRVSREEERQRQEKLAKDRAAAAAATPATPAASSSSTTAVTPAPAPSAAANPGISAEEAQAMDESADAEEARLLAEAMRLSMTVDEPSAPAAGAPAPAGGDIAEALQDPDFMNSLLASAGVPAEDIAIDDLLNTIAGKKPEPKKEEPKKE